MGLHCSIISILELLNTQQGVVGGGETNCTIEQEITDEREIKKMGEASPHQPRRLCLLQVLQSAHVGKNSHLECRGHAHIWKLHGQSTCFRYERKVKTTQKKSSAWKHLHLWCCAAAHGDSCSLV